MLDEPEDKSLLSDEDLMKLYQAGDFASFEIIYGRHSGRIYEYLYRRVRPQIAQDLLQEVFEKLHKARSKYDSQYPFLPWLFAITRNALLDFHKRAETRIEGAQASDTVLANIPAPTLEPNSLDLSPALETLPLNQRRAIELRYLHDWSFEKIASEMQTSDVNVRKLVSRGITSLRNLFRGRKI